MCLLWVSVILSLSGFNCCFGPNSDRSMNLLHNMTAKHISDAMHRFKALKNQLSIGIWDDAKGKVKKNYRINTFLNSYLHLLTFAGKNYRCLAASQC